MSSQRERDLSDTIKQEFEVLPRNFPIVQCVSLKPTDQDTLTEMSLFNSMLKGIYLYGQWATDTAYTLSSLQEEEFTNVFERLSNQSVPMRRLLRHLDKQRENEISLMVRTDMHTTELSDMLRFVEGLDFMRSANVPRYHDIPIHSVIDVRHLYHQYQHLWHDLLNVNTLLRTTFELFTDFPHINMEFAKKKNELIHAFAHVGIGFLNNLELLGAPYEHSKIRVDDMVQSLEYNETLQTILNHYGLLFSSQAIDRSKMFQHVVDWRYEWFDMMVEEIAVNAGKFYDEREELDPTFQGRGRTLTMDAFINSPSELKVFLSESEITRLEKMPLNDASAIAVLSFKDEAYGVDSEVEEEGLVPGVSKHSTEERKSTGMGLSYLANIVETEYGGTVFIHNRRDGLRGGEVFVCLPSFSREKY